MLTLGFSPCPNDTFIFYALLHQKIQNRGLEFSAVIEDVETLNRRALRGELDITKMSFAAFLQAQQHYTLLQSGSALGRGCGPLLISKRKIYPEEISHCSIAIPGRLTTANFLFHAFFPEHGTIREMIFSEIENAVLNEETDLGVIIHENRFTYEKKGLQKVVDLGDMWEQKTHSPIPLGGIFIRKNIPPATAQIVDELIRNSVEYAFAHPDATLDFVKQYSSEMDTDVMWQHIRLYVNEFTIHLGDAGQQAVAAFLEFAQKRELVH